MNHFHLELDDFPPGSNVYSQPSGQTTKSKVMNLRHGQVGRWEMAGMIGEEGRLGETNQKVLYTCMKLSK